MPILGRPIKGQSNDLRQNKMPLLSGLSIYDFGRLISTIIFLMIGQVIKLLLVMIPVRFQLYLDQFHEKIYPSHFLRSKSDERSLHPLANITTFEQMADYWGANYEQHIVRTSDGYFLTLHRLCPDPQSTSKFDQSKVVLFFHGFMMTSEGWLAHPIRSSNLALNLLDKGYDVWLANVRGNKYGIKHKKFKFTDSEFWDFSLDEVALIDLPETVDVSSLRICISIFYVFRSMFFIEQVLRSYHILGFLREPRYALQRLACSLNFEIKLIASLL